MSLKDYNERIERSELYIFLNRHKRVINIIQGLFIIGLLVAINIYVVNDYHIKKQIANSCGYTTSEYKCICYDHYAEDWEDLQKGNFDINLTNLPGEKDVELDR